MTKTELDEANKKIKDILPIVGNLHTHFMAMGEDRIADKIFMVSPITLIKIINALLDGKNNE